MSFDYRLLALAVFAGGCVTYFVFFMPQLSDENANLSSSEVEVAAIRAAEFAYCQTQHKAVNCQCFAQKSGAVRSHNEPHVPGMFYADKQDLARGQATNGC